MYLILEILKLFISFLHYFSLFTKNRFYSGQNCAIIKFTTFSKKDLVKLIIDFHSHAFPDALAEKAVPRLSACGNIKNVGNGKVPDLITHMDEYGVDYSVILNIATNPHQEHKVNDFAIECSKNPRLYSLGSLNPYSENIKSEAKRLAEAGIKGIKIHPDYMECAIDDPKFDAVFEAAIENDFFVVTHSGWDFYSPDFIHCTPERIVKVSEKFPDLKLIAAHMGANRLWDSVEKLLIGRKNIWIDTSLAAPFDLDKAQAKRMLLAHDPDHILFGSDFPWFTPKESVEYLESLELPESLMKKILSENAIKLVGEKK